MTKLLEQAIAKVKQLPDSEQERIAQLILELMSPQIEKGEKQENLSKSSQGKLSEVLLLPELEDNEVLFERNNETGRDIEL
jgi:hypothetical protein